MGTAQVITAIDLADAPTATNGVASPQSRMAQIGLDYLREKKPASLTLDLITGSWERPTVNPQRDCAEHVCALQDKMITAGIQMVGTRMNDALLGEALQIVFSEASELGYRQTEKTLQGFRGSTTAPTRLVTLTRT